jgi:FkbH-like protein
VTQPPALPGGRARQISPALARLRTLHRTGDLAAAFPQVAPLLAELAEGELMRAGALLARLDPADVLAAHPETPVLRVAITARSTVHALLAPLAAEVARHGLLLDAVEGEYGGWLRELTDPASALYAHRPDLVLCPLDPHGPWERLSVPWRPAEVAAALDEEAEQLAALVAAFTKLRPEGRGTLVLNTVPLLRRFTQQLLDVRERGELGVLWREFNATVLRLADPGGGVVVLDLDPLIAEGYAADDPRLGSYAGAHLPEALLAAYARDAAHLARALTGRGRKALVLDLDGTLWDGVLAENGPDGVTARGGRRGDAFHAFQQTVRQLNAQGVLLAVASKNDAEQVRRTLRDHPELSLREADFTSVRADWQPKPQHLAAIAEELGVAVEALVFADDSAFERGAVREALPEVATVALDDEPALHVQRLLADGWFDAIRVTEEDRARPARYRSRAVRTAEQARALDYGAYLAGLGTVLTLAPAATPADHDRVAQLTQRTNRFNLTGERLTPGDVARAARDGALVLTARVRDRHGDEGLSGAAIVTREPGAGWEIRNLLLSCRVLGRGIEDALVAWLLAHARASGAPRIRAHYRAGRANSALAGFWPAHGFTPEPPGPGTLSFHHDLAASLPEPPAHVRLEWRSTAASEK